MDGVWLILDSLSFDATPFSKNGPDTMPNYHDAVKEHGVNFTQAYAPGGFSPSSHASFFTGKLPSSTGMYEAYPRYDNAHQTIAQALGETHRTYMISSNHFLFQGLEVGFDETNDMSREYMVFPEATDPSDFSSMYDENPWWRRYSNFVLKDGKPLRSIVNGAYFKLFDGTITPKQSGDEEKYQTAGWMSDMIRQQVEDDDDTFVVANFMDLHAPFHVSDDAVERYFPDTPREQIPMNTRSRRDKLQGEKSYDSDLMYQLYKAAIWDLDRKIIDLIKWLVENNVFVAVFADHGWYDTNTAYSDERLHVPLTIFVPDKQAKEIDHTVSLRSLPRTTTEVMLNDDCEFEGPSLLNVKSDQTAITEVIHKPNDVYEKTRRVYLNRPSDNPDPDELQRDCVFYRGDAKIQYVQGEFEVIRGDEDTVAELKQACRDLLAVDCRLPGDDTTEYDETTEERLRELGYLE